MILSTCFIVDHGYVVHSRFFFKNNFIYLYVYIDCAGSSLLLFSSRFFSSCVKCFLAVVCGYLIVVASLVVEHRL